MYGIISCASCRGSWTSPWTVTGMVGANVQVWSTRAGSGFATAAALSNAGTADADGAVANERDTSPSTGPPATGVFNINGPADNEGAICPRRGISDSVGGAKRNGEGCAS